VKLHPVQTGVFYGVNGIIGTHQGAHGTPDTGLFHCGPLPDSVKGIIIVGLARVFTDGCFYNPLSEHFQCNGFYRAHSCALAAKGASFIAVTDLPGQIVQA
jgi:hypothetical protein